MKNEEQKPDLAIVRIAVIGVCESLLGECYDLGQEIDMARDKKIAKKEKLRRTIRRFQKQCLHPEIKQSMVYYCDCRYPTVGRICIFCGFLEELYDKDDLGFNGSFEVLHCGQGRKLEILSEQGGYRARDYDDDFAGFGLVADKEWREVLIRTRKQILYG